MLYIFEMANNHQGSVSHAKKIIDEFSTLAQEKNINTGIKFQFRQLDSFIHENFQSSDLKFVERFNSTKLNHDQFKEIIDYARSKNLKVIATPFDNESLKWIEEFKIDIIKIASCSNDDWFLMKEIAKINKKIVISTGGNTIDHFKKVHALFKKYRRDFAFMHCVGEYPTDTSVANLSRITALQNEFPSIEIGFSTHESPMEKSLTPYAVALGCSIVEKHVGVETENIKLNEYSLTPAQMSSVIDEIRFFENSKHGVSQKQTKTLQKLKRGIYVKRDLKKGDVINFEDLYLAMPVQKGQADASMMDDEWGWVQRKNNVVGQVVQNDITAKEPLMTDSIVSDMVDKKQLAKIKTMALSSLEEANVTITHSDNIEISCHYGIENFFDTGALIIDKVNRAYCKKILLMYPNQSHPTHHHLRKEETFELLSGDCKLILNGRIIELQKGKPILINKRVPHSFSSEKGCVIEEISTTHYKNDSVYEDLNISKMDVSDRKIKINLIDASVFEYGSGI